MSHLVDVEWFRKAVADSAVAVEQCRRELGIDPHHDSGADSGSLSEDEERERSERPR